MVARVVSTAWSVAMLCILTIGQAVNNQSQEDKALADLMEDIKVLRALVVNAQEALDQNHTCCACCACEEPGSGTAISSGNTPPPWTTEPASGLCAAFGDPHFTTFDGLSTIALRDGVLWMVKSTDVFIQVLSVSATANLMGLAVGGPFLQGHTLVVYNRGLTKPAEEGELDVLWDGQPILTQRDAAGRAEFGEPFVLWAARRADWNSRLHDEAILGIAPPVRFDVGEWFERFRGKPKGGLYLFKMKSGVEVTLSGADYMSIVVSMTPRASQTGYCGNANQNPDDDGVAPAEGEYPKELAPAWNKPTGDDLDIVTDGENLFNTAKVPATVALLASPVAAHFHETPSFAELSGTKCPWYRLWKAKRKCRIVYEERMRAACISDICLGSTDAVAEGTAEAELMEHVFGAQGLASFVGHGRCLEGEGKRPPSVLHVHDARTPAECRKLLGTLSANPLVLGAQQRRGGSCEILLGAGEANRGEVDSAGSEQLLLRNPGHALRKDMIVGVQRDLSWNCWRLT